MLKQPETQSKPKCVHVMMTGEQHKRIKSKSDSIGITVSALLRGAGDLRVYDIFDLLNEAQDLYLCSSHGDLYFKNKYEMTAHAKTANITRISVVNQALFIDVNYEEI